MSVNKICIPCYCFAINLSYLHYMITVPFTNTVHYTHVYVVWCMHPNVMVILVSKLQFER